MSDLINEQLLEHAAELADYLNDEAVFRNIEELIRTNDLEELRDYVCILESVSKGDEYGNTRRHPSNGE